MNSFSKNPKPFYLKKNESLSPSNTKKASKRDIGELIKISKENRKLEAKLLKTHAKNFL